MSVYGSGAHFPVCGIRWESSRLGADAIWSLTHSEMWLILVLASGLMVTPACGLSYPYGFLASSLQRARLQVNILEAQWKLYSVLMTLPEKSLNITSSYLLVETDSRADEFKEEEYSQWEEGISLVMTQEHVGFYHCGHHLWKMLFAICLIHWILTDQTQSLGNWPLLWITPYAYSVHIWRECL